MLHFLGVIREDRKFTAPILVEKNILKIKKKVKT